MKTPCPVCIVPAGPLLQHGIKQTFQTKHSEFGHCEQKPRPSGSQPALSSKRCPTYGENTRVMSSNCGESPGYKWGTGRQAPGSVPSHVSCESHVSSLIRTPCLSVLTRVFSSAKALFHKRDFSFYPFTTATLVDRSALKLDVRDARVSWRKELT